MAAVVAAGGFIVRLEGTDAVASAGGPCKQARIAYRDLGSNLTMALAKQGATNDPTMLQTTLSFTQAVRGSRCAEVGQMRRQAKLEVAGFCRPCARALDDPATEENTASNRP